MEYCLGEDYNRVLGEERRILCGEEGLFKGMKLWEMGSEGFWSSGVLIKVDDEGGMFMSECDLESYGGMLLKKEGKYEVGGKFGGYCLEEEKREDGEILGSKGGDYIGRVRGRGNYGWGGMIVGEKDGKVVRNELIYKLGGE